MSRTLPLVTLVCACLVVGCSAEPEPSDSGAPAFVASSLTAAQCEYKAFQDNKGRVKICHYDSGKKKKKYVIEKMTPRECQRHLTAHQSGFPDYIALDNDCDGDGCLSLDAPCDPTVPCCEGTFCGNAAGNPASSGTCQDIDACRSSPCGAYETCRDIPQPAEGDASGRVCACEDGFERVGGVCVQMRPCAMAVVDDRDVCTDDACDPATGAVTHAFNSAPCDDGNACTSSDQCANGVCVGGAGPCQGGGTCTVPDAAACSSWSDALDCGHGDPAGDVAVRFGCTAVKVRSCKELSNVVLKFAGGETQRFGRLRGHNGTFAGTGVNAGREVVTAWVKAGRNRSGAGPGFGERFDRAAGPCDADLDDADCEPPIAYACECPAARSGRNCEVGGCIAVSTTDSTCDGVDDDCDGTKDEDAAAIPSANVQGECANDVRVCSGGSYIGATSNYTPVAETCNGKDDNCAGGIDEGLVPRPAANVQGECAGNTEVCDGVNGYVSDLGNHTPSPETCNGKDDDCAGGIDDGVTAIPATNVRGKCANNVRVCIGGSYVEATDNYQPTNEICNGKDDDCAGGIDDGLTAIPATNVRGKCANNVQVCSGGSYGNAPENYQPAAETCNGSDDNCDGSVDEGLASRPAANVQGECAGNVQICSGGSYADTATNYAPTAETCNGKDDNCDGSVDEHDTTPPTISECPASLAIQADLLTGQAPIPDLVSEADASDACTAMNLSQDPAAGTLVDGGEVLVTITATDARGNSATCTVIVTVLDNQPPEAADDSVIVLEDSTPAGRLENRIAVLANDTDPDGNTLVVSDIATYPAHGSATIAPDKMSIHYTPAKDYYGNDTLIYTVTDGRGGIDQATVSIFVSEVNDDPIAADDSATVEEDGTILIDVLANDSTGPDAGLEQLVIPQVTIGCYHCRIMFRDNDRKLEYSPEPNYFGPDSFTYQISDGRGGFDTALVSITVTAVNDAPVANADSYTTAFGTALAIAAPGVLANDSDVEQSALIATLVTGPQHGTATIAANGALAYTPNAGFSGNDSLTYRVSDGALDALPATVSIAVLPNGAPIAGADTFAATEDTVVTVAASAGLFANDSDPEGSALVARATNNDTYGAFRGGPGRTRSGSRGPALSASLDGAPPVASFALGTRLTSAPVVANGVVYVTQSEPNSDPTDPYSNYVHRVRAISPVGCGGSASSLADAWETAPLAGTPADQPLVSGGRVFLPVTRRDPTNGSPTFKVYCYDASTGAPIWTSAARSGTTYSGSTTPLVVGGSLVLPYDIKALARFDVATGQALSDLNTSNFGTGSLLRFASDGTNRVFISGTSPSGAGAIDSLRLDSVHDWFDFNLPSYGFTAPALDGAFVYVSLFDRMRVSRQAGVAGGEDVAWQSNIGLDGSDRFAVSGGKLVVTPAGSAGSVSVKVLDAATGSQLTTASYAPVDGTNPQPASLAATPDIAYVHVSYASTAGATTDLVAVDMVTGAILWTRRDLGSASSPDLAIANGSLFTVTQRGGQYQLVQVYDPPDPQPVAASTSQGGVMTLTSDGSFTYTPAANFNGADTFTYQASDGASCSAPVTATIQVAPSNDPPVAVDDAYSGFKGSALNVIAPAGLLKNDTDVDGDSLSGAFVVSGPTQGSLSLYADGSFTYNSGTYQGTVSFTYKVTDGKGGVSNAATVTLTIADQNLPPVAVADVFTIDEDTTLTVAAPGVLVNDTNADGGPYPMDAYVSGGVTGGKVDGTAFPYKLTGGGFTFTPTANFSGTASFSYLATDDNSASFSNFATVTINVTAVNDPPVSYGSVINVQAYEDYAVDIQWQRQFSDPETRSENLIPEIVSGPAHGSAAFANGVMTYTPDANYFGTDPIVLRVSDGLLYSDPVTFAIAVESSDDPPVAGNDAFSTPEDTAVSGNVLLNDIDVDGPPMRVRFATSGGTTKSGTFTIAENGAFTYTPPKDFNGNALHFVGQDSFTYQVVNTPPPPTSATLTAAQRGTVTITVTPVNDPPVIGGWNSASLYGTENVAGTIQLYAISTGGGADEASQVVSLSVSAADPTMFTSLSVSAVTGTNPNGQATISYTPAPQRNGTVRLTVTANDGQALNATASVALDLRLNAVNDPPALATVGAQIVDEFATLSVPLVVTDPDQPANVDYTFYVTGAGSVVTTSPGIYTYVYTPGEADGGQTYAVTLYAYDNANAQSTAVTFQVSVREVDSAPIVTFDPPPFIDLYPPYAEQPASFWADVSDDSGAPTIRWKVDGVVDPAATATFVLLNLVGRGPHTITVEAEDAGGNVTSVTRQVVLTAAPTALASVLPGTTLVDVAEDGEDVTLVGSGSDPDGSIVAYEWTDIDTNIAVGSSADVVLHLAIREAPYQYRLRVSDDDGRSATADVQVNVVPKRPPIVNAGLDVVVNDLVPLGSELVYLSGTVTDDDAYTVQWMDNGTPIAGATASYVAVSLSSGSHILTLEATDVTGLTASDEAIVTVVAFPVAVAGADQQVIDVDGDQSETFTLDGSDSTVGGGAVEYEWLDLSTYQPVGTDVVVTLTRPTSASGYSFRLRVKNPAIPEAYSDDYVVVSVLEPLRWAGGVGDWSDPTKWLIGSAPAGRIPDLYDAVLIGGTADEVLVDTQGQARAILCLGSLVIGADQTLTVNGSVRVDGAFTLEPGAKLEGYSERARLIASPVGTSTLVVKAPVPADGRLSQLNYVAVGAGVTVAIEAGASLSAVNGLEVATEGEVELLADLSGAREAELIPSYGALTGGGVIHGAGLVRNAAEYVTNQTTIVASVAGRTLRVEGYVVSNTASGVLSTSNGGKLLLVVGAGITNVGTLTTASGVIEVLGAALTQQGLLIVEAGGSLVVPLGALQQSPGVLRGAGTIVGDVTMYGGRVAPGMWASPSVGTLTIVGAYSQYGGALEIDIADARQHDTLVTTSTALAYYYGPPELVVSAPVPVGTWTFKVLSTGSLTGAFSVITAPAGVSVSYDADKGVWVSQ